MVLGCMVEALPTDLKLYFSPRSAHVVEGVLNALVIRFKIEQAGHNGSVAAVAS